MSASSPVETVQGNVSAFNVTLIIEGYCATTKVLLSLFNTFSQMGLIHQVDHCYAEHYDRRQATQALPFFIRASTPHAMAIIEDLIQWGCPYVYFIDDNFWTLPDDASCTPHYQSALTQTILNKALSHAHQVITTSVALAQALPSHVPTVGPITLLPNGVNVDRITQIKQQHPPLPATIVFPRINRPSSSAALLRFSSPHVPQARLRLSDARALHLKQPINSWNNYNHGSAPLRIGYAGSFKAQEFNTLLLPVMQGLHQTYGPTVSLELILESEEAVTTFKRDYPQINYVNLIAGCANYDDYLALQLTRHWQVGLAPLLENPFNRCKTDNKYREYGAFGLAGVYSHVSPYQDVVQHGVTGLLATNTPADWLNALQQYINEPQYPQRIAQQAFTHIQRHYALSIVAPQWAQALQASIWRLTPWQRLQVGFRHLNLRLKHHSKQLERRLRRGRKRLSK
jgi:hypothetical protein